jgi:hypothetical protein
MNVFNMLEREATMKRLAREELEVRKEQLARLRELMAPMDLIENEVRLVTRAAELCRLLGA